MTEIPSVVTGDKWSDEYFLWHWHIYSYKHGSFQKWGYICCTNHAYYMQLGAVITLSHIRWYHIQYCSDCGRTWISVSYAEYTPKLDVTGEQGCLLWGFGRKLTCVITVPCCIYVQSSVWDSSWLSSRSLFIMTSSNENIFVSWPFVREIHQPLVDSPHKGPVTWTFDVPLLLVWTNGWTNTQLTSVLRCLDGHL